MFKTPTKKQGIIAGIVIALIAGLGVAASQVPDNVKSKVINALPGHAEPAPIEQAPAIEEATPSLPEEPTTQSHKTTVDNGSKKLSS